MIGWIWRKNKFVTALYLFFMVAAIGFRTQGADYLTYEAEYLWAKGSAYVDINYWGYYFIMHIEQFYNIDFETHLVIMAIVSCALYYLGIKRLSNNVNIVYALFLIYPFIHEAIQTRTFLADALVLCVLPILLREKRNKKQRNIDYLIFFVVSGISLTIHFLTIIYIACAILYIFMPRENNVFKIGLLAILTYLTIITNIFPKLLGGINERAAYWLTSRTSWGALIAISFTIGIWYLTKYCIACLKKAEIHTIKDIPLENLNKFTDYSLIIIPLFAYDVTFDRLWRIFLILLYACVSNVLFLKSCKREHRISISILIFVLVGALFMYEGESSLLEIMKNNALF
jgi:uncharacterized membrane protein YccF (DUF307 family)